MTVILDGHVRGIYVDMDDPDCLSRYFRVLVYDGPESMRAGALRYEKGYGRPVDPGMFQNAAGVFQPRRLTHRKRHGKREDTTGSFAGILRLSQGWLSGEIIAHESTHASLHLWRMHRWNTEEDNTVDLGDQCDVREEKFAYLLGAVTGSVANLVHRLVGEVEQYAVG